MNNFYKLYKRFRIILLTFALGLASVFVFNGSLKTSIEIYVDVPKTETGEVIVVFPKCRFQMPFSGGSGLALTRITDSEGRPLTEKIIYKEPERLTKCVGNQNFNQK